MHCCDLSAMNKMDKSFSQRWVPDSKCKTTTLGLKTNTPSPKTKKVKIRFQDKERTVSLLCRFYCLFSFGVCVFYWLV